jgi:hypothetical protein
MPPKRKESGKEVDLRAAIEGSRKIHAYEEDSDAEVDEDEDVHKPAKPAKPAEAAPEKILTAEERAELIAKEAIDKEEKKAQAAIDRVNKKREQARQDAIGEAEKEEEKRTSELRHKMVSGYKEKMADRPIKAAVAADEDWNDEADVAREAKIAKIVAEKAKKNKESAEARAKVQVVEAEAAKRAKKEYMDEAKRVLDNFIRKVEPEK